MFYARKRKSAGAAGGERGRTKAILLKPPKGKIQGMVAACWILSVLSLLLPGASLAAAFLLPLFLCPLWGTGKEAWAYPPALALPALGGWLWTRQPMFAFSLLLACAAPLTATALQKKPFPQGIFGGMLAYAFGVATVLLGSRFCVGDDLAKGLTELAVREIQSSSSGYVTLYRLAASGYLSMPEGASVRSLLLTMLEQPALNRQLLLSFQLRFRQDLALLLPSACVHVCLIGGVFCALRTERARGSLLLVDEDQKTPPALRVAPGFSALAMSRGMEAALFGMGALGYGIALSTANGWFVQLAQLLIATFQAGYRLCGAAVLTGLVMRRKPEWRVPAGLLAGTMYALTPSILFLLGMLDPLAHFRTGGSLPNQPKEDE